MPVRTILELRARVRRLLRERFDARGYLEVDTPVLAAEVLPEAHIDPLVVPLAGQPPRWLQASPENLMKRLLAAGSGPIYQFAHAFRAGERGPATQGAAGSTRTVAFLPRLPRSHRLRLSAHVTIRETVEPCLALRLV